MSRRTLLLRAAALGVAAMLSVRPRAADDVADFYKGKTASLYLGYPPSGAYDIYARLIARYMTKYVPGNPQFIVRYKPGAARLNLVNELYNVMPRDGSVFGMFARSVALNRLLGREGANFNPVEFNWIGSANNEVSICGVWHGVGVWSTKDFMSRPLVFAANAPGAESDVYPNILNNLLGHQIQGRRRLSRRQRSDAGARTRRGRRPLRLELGRAQGREARLAARQENLHRGPIRDQETSRTAGRAARHRARAQRQGARGARPDPDAAGHGPAVRRAAKGSRRRGSTRCGAPSTRPCRTRNCSPKPKSSQLEIAPVDGEALQAMVEHMFKSPHEVVEAARKAIAHH